MALNLKNAEVERLAAEIARLTGESKTEAIRRVLEERRVRLKGPAVEERKKRLLRLLRTKVWATIPKEQLGRRLSRAEADVTLGFGPEGGVTIDTSALIAILFAEPGYLEVVDCILAADTVRVGAPGLVEAGVVFSSRRGKSGTELEELIRELNVTVVPFGEAEWHAATEAFARYGRGRHKAQLNYGDCLAYGTAAVAGDSLLFVGGDFTHTDITSAL